MNDNYVGEGVFPRPYHPHFLIRPREQRQASGDRDKGDAKIKQELELVPERVKMEPEESLEYYYSASGVPHYSISGVPPLAHHCQQCPQGAISPPPPRRQPSLQYPPEDSYCGYTVSSASRMKEPAPETETQQSHYCQHGQALSLHLKEEAKDQALNSERAATEGGGSAPPPRQEDEQGEEEEEDYRDRSGTGSSRTVIEFDGNDCVLCRVCGDKASGFHYGVHSCEGCKGFFRRSIQQKIQYRPCSKNQQCSILRINRNRCQYCRLKKCIAAGMSRDAVRFGRVPKREKAKILAAMQTSRIKSMECRVMAEMADESKIIETIVRAHYDTCDYTADKIQPFLARAQAQQLQTHCTGLTCPMKGRPEQSFLDQFSERFMDHVRQVCTFAKSIPGFKCLHHEDQVSLLKSCVFEVLLVRLSGLFNNQSLVCLNGDVIRRETISAMPAGNAKFLMDSVFELAQRINRFRLSDAEIGLFCSVVIITADRPGLRNPELVGRMQSKLKLVLQNILGPQHSHHSAIFSQLLTIVHDLRTLNTLHTEKFLQQAKVVGGGTTTNGGGEVGCPPLHTGGLLYEQPSRTVVAPDWDDQAERDSTGSRSPQSSSDSSQTGGLGHSISSSSYNSMEDLRRSPIGSVSSSESLGSSETFSKLSVNDLKIHGVGSVLLNALTSPALSQLGCPSAAARKRDISRLSSRDGGQPEEMRGQQPSSSPSSHYPESHQHHHQKFVTTGAATIAATTTATPTGCPFKARKLDSPSDSGIDSPKAQGSQSTNTSVCSSPRSSLEEATTREESSNNSLLEDQHPLLKRALQQPPQPFNLGVTGFQDEVYKPHKKFRHSGRNNKDGGGGDSEPTSTQQESAPSPQPSAYASAAAASQTAPSSLVLSHSILASQLAAPPSYSQQRSSPPTPPPASSHHSLLASTLSRPLSVPRPRREEERNELLAALILDGGRYRTTASTAAIAKQPATLLMCAPSHQQQHIPAVDGATLWRSSNGSTAAAGRHLPVPVAPCQPTSSQASPRPLSAAAVVARQHHMSEAAASSSPLSSAVVPSSHLRSALMDSSSSPHLRSALAEAGSSPQPLNLSTRTPPPGPSNNIKAEA